MKTYLNSLQRILNEGHFRGDRTGTGTLSVFGSEERYPLYAAERGYGLLPLVTTKKLHLASIIHELIWMVSGSTNISYLANNGVRIWDEWVQNGTETYKDFEDGKGMRLASGELGPVYGKQWRAIEDRRIIDTEDKVDYKDRCYRIEGVLSEGINGRLVVCRMIDQYDTLLKGLRTNPMSRRHILTAWHVPSLDEMALPPCHLLAQFYVTPLNVEQQELWMKTQSTPVPEYGLSCKLTQRSADSFLGKPFNIAFYSMLTYMFAKHLDMAALDFIWSGGDCHIYNNHLDQVKLQLTREPRPLPTIRIKDTMNPYHLQFDDFIIEGYDPHPHIAGAVSV